MSVCRAGVVVLASLSVLVSCGQGGERSDSPKPYSGAPRSVVVMDAKDSARTIIQVYEPVDGARIRKEDLGTVTFRWSKVPNTGHYMFVANNEIGRVLWKEVVSDTTFAMPSKVAAALAPGERLKWIVQVPGVSASSDIYRVEVVR